MMDGNAATRPRTLYPPFANPAVRPPARLQSPATLIRLRRAEWALNRLAVRVLMLLALSAWAAASHALTLRVGVYGQKPDISIAANGQPAGILGELLNEMARREGWTLQALPCDWAQCLQWLKLGHIDLLPDVHYTPERAQNFSFHHVAALHSWSQIYARPGNTLRSIADLKGHSLAILEGSSQQAYLRQTLDALHVPVRLDSVSRLDDGFGRVQRQQDDAIAADHFYGELTAPTYGLVPTPVIFEPTDAFYATPRGRHPEVLAAIDRYLAAWQAKPDSFYYRTLNEWRRPTPYSALQSHNDWIIGGLGALLALVLALILVYQIRLRRQERRLQASERRFETILGSIDACVCTKDVELRYLYTNRQLESVYGVAEGALIGHRDEDFLDDADTLEAINRSDRAVLDTHKRQVTQPEIVLPGSREPHTFVSIKAPLLKADGTVEAICTVATDITGRVRAEASAHHLAYHDLLTNLANRRQAMGQLESLLQKAHKRQTTGALLVLNLDGFKKINDTLGQQSGDLLLCAIGERLTQTTRDRDLVARTSADEFLVLLDGLGQSLSEAARNAMHVAEKLRLAVAGEAFMLMDKPAYITASIGMTLVRGQEQSLDAVMREADMATYRAKDHGGNQVTFYDRELQSEVEVRLWLEHDLLQALSTSAISLYLQPQFNGEGRVTGAELLARWNHPSHGPVSPSLFIPIAEETGLINLLGEWVLKTACETLLALQKLGETYPISINVSPKRLMEPQFVDQVRETLARMDAPGNRLIFEITEGVLIQDIRAVAERMHALSLLGIRFSIDDFGTGYSNLAYLKRLPLYEMKIDKSLVQDLPGDGENIAIVQMILAMADLLNLRVVAEGVETREQSEFLFSQRCDALQGFLLARPMPIDAWLEQVRLGRPVRNA